MRLTDFGVLSFDCYGTLIDWETGILAEIEPWLAAHGRAQPPSEILRGFAEEESAQQAGAPGAPYPLILERVHRSLADRWGVPADDRAASRFGRSVKNWPAFSDSPDALRYLTRSFRLVILSNVDRESFAVSEKRLGVQFDAVYTAQDIGSYKPDRRNFEYLIDHEQAAGHPPDRLLHVAQSLFHDHVPATDAGLARCWIERPSVAGSLGATRAPDRDVPVHFHYRSLAELAGEHRHEATG